MRVANAAVLRPSGLAPRGGGVASPPESVGPRRIEPRAAQHELAPSGQRTLGGQPEPPLGCGPKRACELEDLVGVVRKRRRLCLDAPTEMVEDLASDRAHHLHDLEAALGGHVPSVEAIHPLAKASGGLADADVSERLKPLAHAPWLGGQIGARGLRPGAVARVPTASGVSTPSVAPGVRCIFVCNRTSPRAQIRAR